MTSEEQEQTLQGDVNNKPAETSGGSGNTQENTAKDKIREISHRIHVYTPNTSFEGEHT